MKITILDHGYVELVEAWGHGSKNESKPTIDELERILQEEDAAPVTIQADGSIASLDYEVGIIEAARQSTQGNFQGWEKDAKLLKRLHDHQHATPFEFAGMVLEVQLPFFVVREWQRHRTQSYNEASARYAALPNLSYLPAADVIVERSFKAAAITNRQAASVADPDENRIRSWVAASELLSSILEEHYQEGLAAGVPKELARKKLPMDRYTRMRCCANLRNWLAFLRLRLHPDAQWEIQQYAHAVGACIEQTFPQTWKLFTEEGLE